MKKKTVLYLLKIYGGFLAATIIIVTLINLNLSKKLPFIYSSLESTDITKTVGDYSITLLAERYYESTGTVYCVFNITGPKGSKLKSSEDSSILADNLKIKDIDGRISVTKRIISGNTAKVSLYLQYNNITDDNTPAVITISNSSVEENFSINPVKDARSITAKVPEVGDITVYEGAVKIKYSGTAPALEKMQLKYIDTTTKFITDNDIVDTVYDTGHELVLILARPLDLQNSMGIVYNDVEYVPEEK